MPENRVGAFHSRGPAGGADAVRRSQRVSSFLLPGAAEAGETLDAVCNNAVIVGLLAGTLLIACSRERIEDEGIGRIRLNALLAALYANCAAVAAAALVTYGAAFLDIMIYNLFTLPLLFLLIFRWQLRRYAKEAADEE